MFEVKWTGMYVPYMWWWLWCLHGVCATSNTGSPNTFIPSEHTGIPVHFVFKSLSGRRLIWLLAIWWWMGLWLVCKNSHALGFNKQFRPWRIFQEKYLRSFRWDEGPFCPMQVPSWIPRFSNKFWNFECEIKGLLGPRSHIIK